MLRAGLILFTSATLAVIMRLMEFPQFLGPRVCLLCHAALGMSIGLFMATYYVGDQSRRRRQADPAFRLSTQPN